MQYDIAVMSVGFKGCHAVIHTALTGTSIAFINKMESVPIFPISEGQFQGGTFRPHFERRWRA